MSFLTRILFQLHAEPMSYELSCEILSSIERAILVSYLLPDYKHWLAGLTHELAPIVNPPPPTTTTP